jgi:DNA-binding SARP family transcriptional activator
MTGHHVALQLAGAPGWRNAQGGAGVLSRKDAALLALLALDGPVARERLVTLLWPEASLARALNNLRQRLFRLRRDIGGELILNQDLVTLAPGTRTDLDPVSADAGELLGGFDFGDSIELDAWVTQARRQWRERRIDAMVALAARHEAAGEWAAAIARTQRIVELSPLTEHAWRRLMRLHYLRGDRGAAIEAFETCECTLRAELGARPTAETIEQLRVIELAQAAPAPAGHGSGRRLLPAALVRPPCVVGRRREWLAMERAWSAGHAFVLIGAAGMGKSRLLGEFLVGRGVMAQAQGRPGDERSPYATVGRLLQQVLVQFDAATDPVLRRELARLLPALGTAARSAGHQAALWQAVEQLLARAHDMGLAGIAVDDLQFADDASLELLRWLVPADGLVGVQVALATRPQDGAARRDVLADWLADSSRPEPVELGALVLADVHELLLALSLPEIGADLAEPLLRHCGGQPFYLLETLKDLVLHGAAEGGLPRPATVLALIERRLDDLPAAALGLVRVAAVAGADLNAARAQHMLELSPLQLAEPWALLEEAGVLEGSAFAHDLMRDAALARVPAPVRRSLHGALAQLLEEDASVPPGRTAWHWLAAERWQQAATGLYLAGLAAHRVGRLGEHVQLLEKSAECFARTGDVAGQFDALCTRLDSLLVREGGHAVLDQVDSLSALAQTPLQRAQLVRVEFEALLNLARFSSVLEREAVLRETCSAHPGLHADALSMLGRAQSELGRHDEALATLSQAMARAHEWADSEGDEAPLARANGHLASVHLQALRPKEGIAAQGRAAEMALRLGDPADHAIHTANLATIYWVHGETLQAYEHACRAQRSYRLLAAMEGNMAAINEITIGLAAMHLGLLDVAQVALTGAVGALDGRSPPAAIAKARVALAHFWLRLGQTRSARDLFDGAPCDVEQLPPAWSAQWHFACALALEADAGGAGAGAAHSVTLAMAQIARLPELSAQPMLLAEWAARVEPARARAALAAAVQVALAQDADALVRSLRLLELEALVRDTSVPGRQLLDQAQACLDGMDLVRHGVTWPPKAWALLERAFGRAGAQDVQRHCAERRLGWLDSAARHLAPQWREPFLRAQGAMLVGAPPKQG